MNKRLALDAQTIAQTIEAIKIAHPELVEDEEAWLLTLASETDLTEILRQIEHRRLDADANAKTVELIVNDMKARKFRFKKREEAMRSLALKLLYIADVQKLEFAEATYGIRNNPPSVIITDEEALPDAACKFKREPDLTAIKSMLEIGSMDGAVMSNGSKSLTIRIR
jgi:hypothetical protein